MLDDFMNGLEAFKREINQMSDEEFLHPFSELDMIRLIKSWDELVGLESDKYYLDIDEDMCNGWIRRKSDNDYMEYLSTNTFYGRNYQYSTVLLQEYGFDVQLENWDGDTEEVNYHDQWLWSGKCEHCRRREYCTTECKAAKQWKEHLETLEQIKNRR